MKTCHSSLTNRRTSATVFVFGVTLFAVSILPLGAQTRRVIDENFELRRDLTSRALLKLPILPSDDTTPGVYQWVGPDRDGGGGDVTDGNNWDPDDSGPPGGSVPGPKDRVLIGNRVSPAQATLTGELNVASASIFGLYTMQDKFSAVYGLQTGGGTIFEKEVTAGFIESGNTTFNKPVVANLVSGIYGGVAFTADLFGPASTTPTRFVAGSSLTSAGALQIQYGIVSFSGGATGSVSQAGVPVFLGLPTSTAVFLIPGQIDSSNPLNSYTPGTLNLSDSGTQFTANGDLIVGVGGGFPTAGVTSEPAAVNITGGAKLITNGKTYFGMYLPDDPDSPDGSGTLTVDGSGSKWEAHGDIIVGAAEPRPRGPNITPGPPSIATGVITIGLGGTLDATGQEIVLGSGTGSEGALTVQDTNSTAVSNDIIVGSLGTGTLLVENGGALHNTAGAIVGQLPGGIGNATVTGMNSKWQIDGNLTVGSSGTGTIAISDNGLLHTTGSATLGLSAGSNGTVSVGDVGSKWQADTTLTIGSFGTGILNIENQGVVQTDGAAVLGEKTGGIGTATITGFNSRWLASDLTIGSLGTGTLNIESQALVQTSGDVKIGEQDGGTGTATITGLGSQWQIGGNLTVGVGGTGTLNIEQGAQMVQSGKSLIVGALAGSTGTLNVKDNISSYTSDNLTIGSLGTGNLTISSMGSVQTTMQAVLGEKVGGAGAVTIDGAGSEWKVDGNLVIGQNGDGTKTSSVTVSSGGLLTVNGPGPVSALVIGQEFGSIGILTIDGKDSHVQGTGAANMEIGGHGRGTLELKNGATLTFNSLTLGTLDGGRGTVTVEGLGGGTPSTFTTTGPLTIGGVAQASAQLNITGGGLVNSDGNVVIARDAFSTGTVLVSGENSVWNLSDGTGNLTVGQAGTASLTVTSKGALSLGTLTVGDTSPSAMVEISSGATLLAGDTVIGKNASSVGTMNVMSGSTVTLKELILGDKASSSGSLTVQGPFSASNPTSVTVTGLEVGSSGHGELAVRNGATFEDTGSLFQIDGNNSSVTVDGLGSFFYADRTSVEVGATNQATLTISNQGFLRTAGAFIRNGSTVHVNDANSRWVVGDNGLHVGATGNGFLIVDGGMVTVNSTVTLGETDFGQAQIENNGSLTVTGGNSIVIGGGSKGELVMFSGAQVSAAFAVIGQASDVNLLGPGAQFTVDTLSVGRSPSDTGALNVNNGHVSSNLLLVSKGSAVNVTGGSVDLGSSLGQAPAGQLQVGFGGSLKDNGAVTGNVTTQLGGTVGGSGTINGKLINGGKVSPGDPQTLTVNGDYQQLNGGLLQIAIAGKTMPEFDHLNVTGHVTLDMAAKLELDFMNGFAPKTGDKFDFLQSGDAVITDNFSEVVITGLEPGFQFVVAPDGVGSFGLVALNDGVATTVPEPSTYVLVILGILFSVSRARPKKNGPSTFSL